MVDNATLAKFGEQGSIGAQPEQERGPVPTDPLGFQKYLNQIGLSTQGDKWQKIAEDGKIGPKTLGAAKALGIAVPSQLQAAQKPASTTTAPAQNQPQQQTNAGPLQDVNAQQRINDPEGWINANRPDVSPYLAIPELKQILINDAIANKDPDAFKADIAATDWWKNTADAARQWEVLQKTQPGEAQAQIRNKVEDIRQQAINEGINLDDNTLTQMANQALTQGWDNSVLLSELHKRPEYMGVSDSQRKWNETLLTNPAEAEQERVQKRAEVSALAQKLGVVLDPTVVANMSEDALKNNWDSRMLQQAVGSQLYTTNATGAAITSENDLRQIAKDWGFTIGDGEMNQYLQGIAEGNLSTNDYQSSLQQRAIQTYGYNQALVDAMSRGISPTQYYQPYAQVAERELGVPANQQDWTDPKWQVAINYNDPKTGIVRPMNTAEWQQTIRSNDQYGWRYSQTANDMAASLAKNVLNAFGGNF